MSDQSRRVKMNGVSAVRGMSVLLLVGLAGCGSGEVEVAPTIATTEVTRINLEIVAEAAGSLAPVRSVQVMSKASGAVVQVLVDTGDRIEEGTLMARIDPRDVQNAYDQSEADFQVAQERFKISEAQLKRSADLLAARVITEQDHESRNVDFANARASLIRAQTTLDLARLRLEDVTIRAPLPGTVLTRTVEQGQVISSPSGNVSGGTALFTIADLSLMQVRSMVNEADVGRLQAGMTATVHVDAFPDRTFQGEVEKIEAQATVQQGVVNFPVIVTLDNAEGLLKPGMSANVTIMIAERANALALPNESIVAYTEMLAAAQVLGVPDDRLLADQSGFQELQRQLAAGGAEAAGALAAGRGRAGGAAAVDAMNLEQLRQQMAASQGAAYQAEIQALMRQVGGGGGVAFRGGGGGGGGGGNRGGGNRRGGGTTNRSTLPDQARPGVVFIQDASGGFTARAVLVGVTDWSSSEIMAGIEDGEIVALLGGVSQQAQQSTLGRGGFPGGGGQFRF
ncbi:MAG: efflux RND transporter periplasmic adaptor subunit [Gemmatimonadetes bacterium]|nr:efflux RND transporter periplasmic adaptor subunit [Gemmatimonadota bacterium]